MIPIDLLEKYGAVKKSFDKGAAIFNEGSAALHYYQVISGEVKMCNFNDDGREFIQGFFYDNQSFGEPPLFLSRTYPAQAIAVEPTQVYKIGKDEFVKLLHEHPEISLKVIENLAQRLHYKAVMAAEISSQEPEHRLLRLIDYSITYLKLQKNKSGHRIDFTRQQMADLTGLRVETVIRAIKSLEKKGELRIIERKVYR
jgi:CRP-like cAMP-binding protein